MLSLKKDYQACVVYYYLKTVQSLYCFLISVFSIACPLISDWRIQVLIIRCTIILS